MWQKLRTEILYDGLPEILGGLLCTYQHLILGVDEVSGYWWQLATAISDQGDGLTIYEQLSQGYNCSHCHITFEVVLRFLYNFIDMTVLPLVMGLGDCAQKHSLAHGTFLLQPLRLFGLLLKLTGRVVTRSLNDPTVCLFHFWVFRLYAWRINAGIGICRSLV